MAIQNATAETFDALIREDFVIVDFYSSTCVPCKMFSRILEDIEAEFPFVNIVKVNTTEEPELGNRFDIRAVPTIHFYKDGERREERLGVIPEEELREMIGRYLY